jgi:hypothetical protein
LSIRHWERLKSGALAATTPRVDWASLMRRTFAPTFSSAPRCSGRLRVVAVIDDPTIIRTILDELHIPRTRAPPHTRDPTLLFVDDSPSLDAP